MWCVVVHTLMGVPTMLAAAYARYLSISPYAGGRGCSSGTGVVYSGGGAARQGDPRPSNSALRGSLNRRNSDPPQRPNGSYPPAHLEVLFPISGSVSGATAARATRAAGPPQRPPPRRLPPRPTPSCWRVPPLSGGRPEARPGPGWALAGRPLGPGARHPGGCSGAAVESCSPRIDGWRGRCDE